MINRDAAKALLETIMNEHPDLLGTEINNGIKKKQAKTMYSFKIEDSTLDRAKKLAESADISVSSAMRQAVEIGLPQLERQQ